MKRFSAIAVLVSLVLFAGSAFAQGGTSLGWGQRVAPPQGGNVTYKVRWGDGTVHDTTVSTPIQGQLKIAIVGGVNPADSAGVPLQVDAATGSLRIMDTDRDRDFPLITQLFSGQQLLAGQTFSMTTGVPMLQYTRAAIMLTFAPALADTDSVRIAVKVYGLTSSTSGNWHLWTPTTVYGSTDTCAMNGKVAADSGAAAAGRCPQPLSFFVLTNAGVNATARAGVTVPAACQTVYAGPGIAGTGRVRIRQLPAGIIRQCSANAVMLNLTDNAGAPCPYPYIRIEVTNASTGSTLTNIEANIWPRVQ